MRRPSITRLVLLSGVAVVGCEGTSGPELNVPDPTLDDLPVATNTQDGNPLLGAWLLTSAVVGDDELVTPNGLSLILSFRSDGAYSWSATNDFDYVFCDSPETSCTVSGTYTYTRTTITLDEEVGPEPGPDTGLYALCGGQLIYMDDPSEEGGTRLTFKRTRRDCYVQDCT